MSEDKTKASSEGDLLSPASAAPLVFISHDTRDADLAEAFSKLLKSVSAGMIKTFRSSDKKSNEGIDFGDEWYKRLMAKLQTTSDVVCLFTAQSGTPVDPVRGWRRQGEIVSLSVCHSAESVPAPSISFKIWTTATTT